MNNKCVFIDVLFKYHCCARLLRNLAIPFRDNSKPVGFDRVAIRTVFLKSAFYKFAVLIDSIYYRNYVVNQ